MDEKYMQHGAFSWCDLLTTDADAAKTFYTQLFGWTTEEMTLPEETVEEVVVPQMTYTILKAGGRPIGGIMAKPKEAQDLPSSWGAYVTVDDVDLTAQTATQLGGKLFLPPHDIPDVGRVCIIEDPQGAMIGVIKYVDV
jgi:predicted enzyme related to lactoylglutathione lyase